MTTKVLDLQNQLKFLGIEHLEETFNAIFQRCGGVVVHSDAMDRLMYFLRPIIMRHSQDQKYRRTLTTLMSLPPKTERHKVVKFTAKEKEEFEKIEKATQDWYIRFRSANEKSMSKHFLKIASKLTAMRIACAGGKYPIHSYEYNAEDEIKNDAKIEDNDMDIDDNGKKKTSQPLQSKFVFKSKFKSLLKQLIKIRDRHPESKSLVFSQFTSTLNWLKDELPKNGFQFRTLSGDMSMKKRAKALSDFQNDPPTTIFLLSMRAGAVGINLTQANRVFLMEPSFNPALEAQAIGRIHRLGQERPVEIVRLLVQNSYEDRMMNFLKKKYSKSCNAIAGNLITDKAKLVTEEFDLLFGVESLLPTDERGGDKR